MKKKKMYNQNNKIFMLKLSQTPIQSKMKHLFKKMNIFNNFPKELRKLKLKKIAKIIFQKISSISINQIMMMRLMKEMNMMMSYKMIIIQ